MFWKQETVSPKSHDWSHLISVDQVKSNFLLETIPESGVIKTWFQSLDSLFIGCDLTYISFIFEVSVFWYDGDDGNYLNRGVVRINTTYTKAKGQYIFIAVHNKSNTRSISFYQNRNLVKLNVIKSDMTNNASKTVSFLKRPNLPEADKNQCSQIDESIGNIWTFLQCLPVCTR